MDFSSMAAWLLGIGRTPVKWANEVGDSRRPPAPVIRLPDGHSSARASEDIGLNCTRQKEMMSTP
jgi:hypothetical protein